MPDLIIIDITDKENILLDDYLNIKNISGSGTLLIKNTSQQSRLWNLSLDLKEIMNTNTAKEHNVGAVNPGQEFSVEYEIQNLKEPLLKLVEVFDTERTISDVVNNAFLYENKNSSKLKLSLTNTLDIPIVDIKMGREIPVLFQDIEILMPNFGEAELFEEGGKRYLSWNINSLGGQQTAELEVNMVVVPKERKDVALGTLKLTYLINEHKRTMMDPEIRGLTDSMSGVTREEGAKPGTWECNVEFINESEFQVRLEDIKVVHKITTGTETVASETPNKTLTVDETWDFDFQVESQNVPELDSTIIFTPLFVVVPRLIGEINKETTYYHVLSGEVHKAINPPEVAAYANTDMTIENTIPNMGTSDFETLEIIDEIPPDFIPPQTKQIKFTVSNPEGTIEIQERTEFIGKVAIDPNDQSPDTKHILNVSLHNLGKQLPPNSKLVMSYPLLAKNPKPEVRYNTPVQIKANTLVKGKDFVISPPEEPVVIIKYVKRKLKTLKSIKPGINAGEFDISIRIQNKGGVELENLVVRDKIPPGFSIAEFDKSIPYEKVGDELEIKIDELKAEESINIKFTCSGSGDYPRTEPSVIVKGRGESKPSEAAPKSAAPTVTELSHQKSAQMLDVFKNIYRKIDEGTKAAQLADFIEGMRDAFPSGPVLHQIMQFVRDTRAHGDKMVVGSLRDDVLTKLKDFQERVG